jgi:hypothetical protein
MAGGVVAVAAASGPFAGLVVVGAILADLAAFERFYKQHVSNDRIGSTIILETIDPPPTDYDRIMTEPSALRLQAAIEASLLFRWTDPVTRHQTFGPTPAAVAYYVWTGGAISLDGPNILISGRQTRARHARARFACMACGDDHPI